LISGNTRLGNLLAPDKSTPKALGGNPSSGRVTAGKLGSVSSGISGSFGSEIDGIGMGGTTGNAGTGIGGRAGSPGTFGSLETLSPPLRNTPRLARGLMSGNSGRAILGISGSFGRETDGIGIGGTTGSEGMGSGGREGSPGIFGRAGAVSLPLVDTPRLASGRISGNSGTVSLGISGNLGRDTEGTGIGGTTGNAGIGVLKLEELNTLGFPVLGLVTVTFMVVVSIGILHPYGDRLPRIFT
jgi:hypothetical protein